MYAERSDRIGGFRFDQASSSDVSEDFYLAAHPGYCVVDEEYMDVGLDQRDHADYSKDFFDEFARKVDEDVTVGVLEEQDTNYTREFLGDLEVDVDYFFETIGGKARPTKQDADEFIDVLRDLEDDSVVKVSGEVNGLCVGQAGQIVEYVSDAYDLGLDIDRGVAFPERPVERVDENLRFV